jgi:hypothetical protein
MSSEISDDSKAKEVPMKAPSLRHGDLGVVDDQEASNFYGSSVSDTYRLKSELVAQHLAGIGMGKYVQNLALYRLGTWMTDIGLSIQVPMDSVHS